MDQWHTGFCPMTPILVDIPFSQLGAFVFHCHILDHEDGGMMAIIRVLPRTNPSGASQAQAATVTHGQNKR